MIDEGKLEGRRIVVAALEPGSAGVKVLDRPVVQSDWRTIDFELRGRGFTWFSRMLDRIAENLCF